MTSPLDASNLRQMILDGPDQFQAGFDLARGVKIPGDFKSIMISGMGGSALPGNLFRIYLGDLARRGKLIGGVRPAIYQNRYYTLPHEAYDGCLNFICSYSGNTEETIASFQEVIEKKLPCIAISAGGRIETMAKEYGVPHVKLPLPSEHFQPRMGTGYFFSVMFQILVNQGLVPDVTDEILMEAAGVKTLLPTLETDGRALAEKLKGKTPVIYASTRFKSVAMVWKIKFNENAKTPAFWNFFSELNHNEMVGWTLPQGKFIVLMLRDLSESAQLNKRYDITAELLRKQGVEVEILDMVGESVYSKVFTSIALGDFASYFLALEYGQDPTPVVLVEELKKLLV